MAHPDVWIVIPAFNEAKSIGKVISDLRDHGWNNVLVINDGSTDATAVIAITQGARVISLKHNQGQGAALAAGFAYLDKRERPGVIVTFDADGQHRALDILPLVSALEKNSVAVALGSRFLEKLSPVPFWRGLMLRAGVVVTRWLTGLAITDIHNGLRALTRPAYTIITITEPGMAHASEILQEISRHHLSFVEIPVTILYPKNRPSQPIANFIPLGFKLVFAKLRS